jgi:hypothetical protein
MPVIVAFVPPSWVNVPAMPSPFSFSDPAASRVKWVAFAVAKLLPEIVPPSSKNPVKKSAVPGETDPVRTRGLAAEPPPVGNLAISPAPGRATAGWFISSLNQLETEPRFCPPK